MKNYKEFLKPAKPLKKGSIIIRLDTPYYVLDSGKFDADTGSYTHKCQEITASGRKIQYISSSDIYTKVFTPESY